MGLGAFSFHTGHFGSALGAWVEMLAMVGGVLRL